MNLYLVQHGKAKEKDEDPKRPLSDIGKSELHGIMKFLEAHKAARVEKIFHSGKLRAEQTALLLADVIKPNGSLEEENGLAPLDDPAIWADRLGDMHEDVMLVGHLPHMSRLASLLLTGDPSLEPVHFRNAGIICLVRDPGGHWGIEWVITPYLLTGKV